MYTKRFWPGRPIIWKVVFVGFAQSASRQQNTHGVCSPFRGQIGVWMFCEEVFLVQAMKVSQTKIMRRMFMPKVGFAFYLAKISEDIFFFKILNIVYPYLCINVKWSMNILSLKLEVAVRNLSYHRFQISLNNILHCVLKDVFIHFTVFS